ncbi:alpha-mannosidase [Geminocystis sp. NIES-3709]|uniref:alpha-mannosidase n=1 Tax=Geminocystis sp. NIES-3709 TaxID=1617448 RepID=UPI0005FCA243|nr:alpha-mannosidase [Geminocystis sp. NIES-3709]BAQ63607.1 alpha-mannosidase [Geminocystis sp. NIES-3709]
MNLQKVILTLKSLTELEIQNNWFYLDRDLDNSPINIDQNWQKGIVNEKNYLVWEKGNQVRWFAQKIIIPKSLNNNYPLDSLSLRIALTWWAELAQIFVNGKLVCEGDLFDCSSRILFTEKVNIGEEYIISLRLVSPSHDIGGLMASKCLYESNYNDIDPSFIANELTILEKYINQFYPEKNTFLEEEVSKINWNVINNQSLFRQELANLRNRLLPLSNYIKERNFYLLGHAHLDMAWLWTLEETYEVAQRTFNSVLNLQKNYSYLTFGHTTAYLYKWIENHNLPLFTQIQQAVKNNLWEILGGMWVEPDVNLISGESLVRQLLYGQKYFLEKFGKYNNIAWLPDTFGFPWQLPQILQQAEINYFVTGKLHWNDTNKFPYGCFWWQSPDGSRIFSLMSPPNVAGVMDTNPLTMTNYSVDWENQTGLKDVFWLPGVGDHGGGPTRDMLEVGKRYDRSPFFPKLNFTTAQEYLEKISSISCDNLPVWNNELYLELHRGCYTTHGDQKYFNRYSEKLLYQAELFSTIANILSRKFKQKLNINADHQKRIKENWQKVLLNQFHDILPGTSITPVFTEANQLWQEIINDTESILQDSLTSITSYINFDKISQKNYQIIVIFNSLNWQRSEIIEIDINNDNGILYNVFDENGKSLKTQISKDGKLLFFAKNIPSIGYKSFYLKSNETEKITSFIEEKNVLNNENYILENQYIKVNIDIETGNIISFYDKINNQEVLNGYGNELQLFEDKGQYWDAWNIDPHYQNYPLENPTLTSIKWLEKGLLRQIIRIEKTFNRSSFIQDYILNFNTPILTIKNKVHWQEDYTLLKVNFPLKIESNFVTYDIACGNIKRTTKPETDREKAQWEVCGHYWADLSNNNYGVSLLNDCKYGYDSKPNQLRLTLLRSPKWPDEKCDRVTPLGEQGYHEFSYSLYPHKNDWKKGNTVKKGYELNVPLQILFLDKKKAQLSVLPTTTELIKINADNLILMALKITEEDSNKILFRGYECYGDYCDFTFKSILDFSLKTRVNLLEHPVKNQNQKIKPYQIFSFICE